MSQGFGIELRAYEPTWVREFDTERRALLELTPLFMEIQHIGSTSIPGLTSKPIIDLMAAVADLSCEGALADQLGSLSYQHRDGDFTDKLVFRKTVNGRRTHHLHVVTASTIGTRHEILFRNRLRRDAALAARYADLKRSLAASDLADAFAYSRGKTQFVQATVNLERFELGLPLVDVYAGAGPARQAARPNPLANKTK